MSLPLILDTDIAMGAPGSDVDDGFALAMALADPDIDLELITTVNGNTDVDTATALGHELLHRLGRSGVPVLRGADRPLRAGAAGNPAVQEMITRVLDRPGRITLVAIGPLTNVALAIQAEPRFAAALGDLVIMGGFFAGEPVRPSMPGEFNAWSDPEAVAVVLAAPVRARWVGLDVTLRVRLSRDEAQQMADSGHPFESFAGRYSLAWIDHIVDQDEEPDSCALHDPLAVAVVTRPELVRFQPVRLSVDVAEQRRGMMTVDRSETPNALTPKALTPNALIGVEVDSDGFRRHFRTLLQSRNISRDDPSAE